MKILLLSNTAWSIWNFRRGLVKTLLERGHTVVAVAPPDDYVARIEGLGCRFLPLRKLRAQGQHIAQDLLLIKELRSIFQTEKPECVLSYTIKPNIYAGLAARGLALRTLPTVNGLGYVFQQQNALSGLVKWLFRQSFGRARQVFFQNADDREFFQKNRLISEKQSRLVRGSGVNVAEFRPSPGKTFAAPPVFLFAARLVAEKGVFEYLAAAEQVKARLPGVRFLLAGLPADNPNALSASTLDHFLNKNIVERLASTDDMAGLLDTVDCVVLPSYYREGVPRVLLEALAKGLPVITTDQPGCRDTVDAGENGWLIPPRDIGALAGAMFGFCEMSPQLRAAFGRASRAKAVQTFDEQLIIQDYLDAIEL